MNYNASRISTAPNLVRQGLGGFGFLFPQGSFAEDGNVIEQQMKKNAMVSETQRALLKNALIPPKSRRIS